MSMADRVGLPSRQIEQRYFLLKCSSHRANVLARFVTGNTGRPISYKHTHVTKGVALTAVRGMNKMAASAGGRPGHGLPYLFH